MLRLESSQIKARHFKNEMEQLEDERRKIANDRQQLLNEKNQESDQWKERYQEMTLKNDQIVANLAAANQCYLNQVTENEKLSKNIETLQTQHREFLGKFREIELKLAESENQVEAQARQLEESANRLPHSPMRTQSAINF